MERLHLDADAAPEQAEIVLIKLSELFDRLDKRREFQSRIRGMDRDAKQFGLEVRALAASCFRPRGCSDGRVCAALPRAFETPRQTLQSTQCSYSNGNAKRLHCGKPSSSTKSRRFA